MTVETRAVSPTFVVERTGDLAVPVDTFATRTTLGVCGAFTSDDASSAVADFGRATFDVLLAPWNAHAI